MSCIGKTCPSDGSLVFGETGGRNKGGIVGVSDTTREPGVGAVAWAGVGTMENGVSSIPVVNKRGDGPNEKCSSCCSTAEGTKVELNEGVCDGVDEGDSTCLSLVGGGTLSAGGTDGFQQGSK